MGLALESVNNDAGAMSEYKEALRLNPNNAAVHYDMGILLNKQRDYAGALAAYKRATELNPRDWAYWYNMGLSAMHNNDHDAAIAANLKAKELYPNSLEARQNLGAEYCETKRHAQAISEFRELLKIDPAWNMARPCLMMSLRAIDDIDGAMKVAEQSLRYEPEDAWTLQFLAQMYVIKHREPEAEALYQRMINVAERSNPETNLVLAGNLVNRAQLYASEAKFQQSDEDFKRAIAILQNANPEVTRNKLQATMQSHQAMLQKWHSQPQTLAGKKSALIPSPAANSPVNGPPMPPVAMFPEERWRTDLMAAKKAGFERRFADAERLFAEALNDAESIVPASNHMVLTTQEFANIYMVQHKLPEAEQLLKKALDDLSARAGTQPLDAVSLTNTMAMLYTLQSKMHDAELLYAKNLSAVEANVGWRDPQLESALSNLENSYLLQRKYAEAEPIAKRRLKIAEEFYGVDDVHLEVQLDSLAGMYVSSHKYELAEPLYRRALAIKEKAYGMNSTRLSGTLSSLEQTLRNLGKPDEAKLLEARREAIGNSGARN
ncbi:MAG: Tetratricopeptide 2 repeat protein [Acidobacteriales bacterium]|nr:Tetratricopeptide 2 repeat protein [Terriglobales bacterium]